MDCGNYNYLDKNARFEYNKIFTPVCNCQKKRWISLILLKSVWAMFASIFATISSFQMIGSRKDHKALLVEVEIRRIVRFWVLISIFIAQSKRVSVVLFEMLFVILSEINEFWIKNSFLFEQPKIYDHGQRNN